MTQAVVPLTALSETQRAQALERLEIIRPAVEKKVSQAQVARTHNLPASTVQLWVKHYRERGLAGLAPSPRSDKGKSCSLLDQAITLVEGLALQTPPRSASAIQGLNPVLWQRLERAFLKRNTKMLKRRIIMEEKHFFLHPGGRKPGRHRLPGPPWYTAVHNTRHLLRDALSFFVQMRERYGDLVSIPTVARIVDLRMQDWFSHTKEGKSFGCETIGDMQNQSSRVKTRFFPAHCGLVLNQSAATATPIPHRYTTGV